MLCGALELCAAIVPEEAGSVAAPAGGRVYAAGGLDNQVAKALRVKPGAAQHRRHHLVVDQLVEGGLIAAAIGASGHVPLLTSAALLSTIIPKDVVIVTRGRKLSGNLSIGSPELPCRWNRARQLPRCFLTGCRRFYDGSPAAIPGGSAGRPA